MLIGAVQDAVATALIVGFAAPLVARTAGSGLAEIAALMTVVLGVMLVAVPRVLVPGRLTWGMLYPSSLAGLLVVFVDWSPRSPFVMAIAAATAAAMVLLAALIAINLHRAHRAPHATMGWIALVLLVMMAAPVWLAPLLETYPVPRWVLDALIVGNPITPLALATGTDYPRTDWLYLVSPLGSLRYDYPDPGRLILGSGSVAGLLALRKLRTSSDPDHLNRSINPWSETVKHLPTSLIALTMSVSLTVFSALAAEPPSSPAQSAAVATAATLDSGLRDKVKRAIDDGLRFLREQQADDGSWSSSVGVTALALRAFLESPRNYTEEEGPFIARPVQYLLSHVNDDGSISDTNHNRNYNTAVALVALEATGNPAYADIIAGGQGFLTALQSDEGEGYAPSHKYYGGIGYGGDERPDLSNTYMALEALKATDFDPEDPVWEKALTFVSRTQNNSETNDLDWAGNDGGFAYMPGSSPHGGAVSYGGMTHAGLLSLLFAGVDKEDPRVKAAYDWIRANYTVENNPAAKKNQGLYYYYNAFAKSMLAYGEPELTDTAGVAHNWRNDLANKLMALQRDDGAWINASTRWWEGDPNLCTAWSTIALDLVMKD